MNIIIIPAFFQTKKYPILGSFFSDQAKALQKSGHQVSILYCDTYSVRCIKDYVAYEEECVSETEGIRIYRKRCFCPLKHGMEGYRRRFSQGVIQLYQKYLAGDRIDMIHAHCCVWAGYAAMKLSETIHVPYVVTEHATLFQLHRDEIRRRNEEYIKEVFGKAKRLICVSRAFADLLSEYRTDIDIVGNVVDCDRFGLAEQTNRNQTIRFLTVCHMVDEEMLRKKGIDILLKAWKELSAKIPNVRLTIGGGGQGVKKAVEWCREYGVEQTVEFTGMLSREQVVMQMQECDVFVLPSRYETFGVVYIEAMACGKPVIAAANGGPDDFVKDFNGILIQPDNVKAFAEAMLYMAGHREQYQSKRIADYAMENFSGQAIAAQLTSLYSQILCGK